MGRIAVDVVLLPDQPMTQWALHINKELVARCGSELVLGEEACLPHVSLAMGCLDERGIGSVQEILPRLAATTPPGQLNAIGIRISTNAQDKSTSLLEIEISDELMALHERVMREVGPLFSHDVTESMIAGEPAAESTLDWIRNYPEKAAFERFSPHITLGYGRAETGDAFPMSFGASRLALCHVGNHGTCRRLIISVDLP